MLMRRGNAHEVDGIFGAELDHDASAVDLNCPWTNSEISCGFLVGRGCYNFS